jgi:hypothetical protein
LGYAGAQGPCCGFVGFIQTRSCAMDFSIRFLQMRGSVICC